jgi:putative transposase
MRQSRFTETEIIYAVKQVELGIPVQEIARKYGVSNKTVYRGAGHCLGRRLRASASGGGLNRGIAGRLG